LYLEARKGEHAEIASIGVSVKRKENSLIIGFMWLGNVR